MCVKPLMSFALKAPKTHTKPAPERSSVGPPTLNDIHQILTWLGWSRAQTYGMVACMTPSVEAGATQTHFARTAYTEAPTQEYTHKPTNKHTARRDYV